MRYDIVLCGVGGQGILSIAAILDRVALARGLHLKQAEVHGMAQRGGAVQSHLRISDQPIRSDLIPVGKADMVLSVEPMEALRYLQYLREDGAVVASTTPFVNIPNYPELEDVLAELGRTQKHVLVDSRALAKEAGSTRTENTVMLGAASRYVPLPPEELRADVGAFFAAKGEAIVTANERAFDLGREAALATT